MYMSNADIVKEYKEAKDRSAQVKILRSPTRNLR